jgi:DNA-binding transcriptional LysR family regulator
MADMQMITVATPSYLQRHAIPTSPNALVGHACIHFRNPKTGQAYDWEFHKGRKIIAVPTKSRLMVSDAGTMLTECIAGIGIAQVRRRALFPTRRRSNSSAQTESLR